MGNVIDKLRMKPEEETTTTTREEDAIDETTQRLRQFENLCGELKNCRVTDADLQTEVIIYEHLEQLDALIENWPIGESPDFRDYFSREEMDWLLTQAVTNNLTYSQFCRGKRLVEFVARSGYRDEPPADSSEAGAAGKPILSRTTPIHRAARYENRHNNYDESCLDEAIGELFKIYDKFGANHVDELGVTHFHVACWHGCADAVGRFLAAGQEPNCREYRKVDPPLYLAAKANRKELVEALLRGGAHPNLHNRQGWTALHAVCMAHRRGCNQDSNRYDELMEVFLETDKQMGRRVQVNARDRKGYGPLHFALMTGCRGLAEILLRNGADPNLTNDDDQTPLHLVSLRDDDDVAAVESFFAVCEQVERQVEVNARDYLGNAPLHEAARCGNERVIGALLRRHADPNAINERGLTPLHAISDREADDNMPEIVVHDDDDRDDYVAEAFFKFNDEIQVRVLVDAEDRQGRTPLTLALLRRRKKTIETLLRRGANPNLPNARGFTPLHVLCRRHLEDDLARMFLDIVDELQLTLRVDARDNEGRTPLQWATVNFLPNTIDALLDNGAKLDNFVFPTGDHFNEAFRGRRREYSLDFQLRLPSGALIVVDRLASRGYGMSLDDAVKIMRLFAEYRLFAESKDSIRTLLDDDDFAERAKKIDMKPGLALYDLIQLPAKEAARALTYSDFLEFAHSIRLWGLCGSQQQEACTVHLAETMSCAFFRKWALPAYLELTHYRLPILCCDLIIEELTNEDLYNICLAVTDESS